MQTKSDQDIFDNIVYYQNTVMKKEGLKTWVPYWTVVRGRWMLFYEGKKEGGKPTKLIKTIELPDGANCALVPRQKKRYPFSLDNGHGNYYFKCETELQRYCWIFCILLASTGKPPKPAPKSVPENLLESVAYPKMAKFDQKIQNSNKKLEKLKVSKPDKMNSQQRLKYAKRLDAKANRYRSRSTENLRDDESSDGEYEERRAMSARAATNRRISTSDVKQLRRTSSHSSVEIHVQVHSPVPERPKVTKPITVACDSTTPVLSIIEIEDDVNGTVHVINPTEALPNMVVDEPIRRASLSARTVSNKKKPHLLEANNHMVHSRSMTNLGQANLGMNIDDEDVIITSRPLSANNRSRTGLSGLESPRIGTRKHAADSSSRVKSGQKHHTMQETSPRSPVPKSRYSRYNIPASDA